ncbi:hypothetical protein GJAV_G00247310 [Gymnothorax javanicus]|nr:hypothetical protein GJAV_G00247310 [Gymnothorax javanicus]
MDLVWDDIHCSGTFGFSRDLYDKHSLAPNVKELWAIAQSRSPVKAEVKSESEVISSNNPDSTPSLELDNVTHGNATDFPEPKVPFPRLSWMTVKEHSLYVEWMRTNMPPKFLSEHNLSRLQEQVSNETSEFMKYLQEVAKICAEEYNYICQGAALYSEECLRASLEMVKNYPPIYLIHEMTSITGGKFNPCLSLHFEKQLLALGDVMMVALHGKHGLLTKKNVKLAEDCESVSAEALPVKKASSTHRAINDDPNAEKLCAKYKPHVCLTKQAFHRLLNNHGPEYSEQWEIPVWVKMTAGKDPRKEVYIDSPLVKTEMAVREKNQLFHEESVKLALKKICTKTILELQLDKSSDCMESQRSQVSVAEDSVDFEVDLSDLETFGESALKSLKEPTPSGSGAQPTLAVVKSPSRERPQSSKKLEFKPVTECSADSSSNDSDEERLVIDAPPSPQRPKPKSALVTKKGLESPNANDTAFITPGSHSSDSFSDPLQSHAVEPLPDTPRSPSPDASRRAQSSTGSPTARGKAKKANRVTVPRVSQKCDQLGQILRMQSALLKPSPNTAQDPVSSPPRAVPQSTTSPPAQSHLQSLVKPCVSSYLEAHQGLVQGTSVCSASAISGPVNTQTTVSCKGILSEDLLLSAEDGLDYEGPEEGNVLYCLYSLKDILIMVRSCVPLAQKKTFGTVSEIVPAHILPKLEYQMCYGLECLTKSEACQLWAERRLHASTCSYVARIDVFTSKMLKAEEMSHKKIMSASCAFSPAKSLNILHHLLQKVADLQEGRYLLCHKAGDPLVTILKASEGKKAARATYDLHQAHSQLPQASPQAPVPWVPVDPTHLLHFHTQHSRIPCTFPPRPDFQVNRSAAKGNRKGKGKAHGALSQPGTAHGPAKKKRKQAHRRRKNKPHQAGN